AQAVGEAFVEPAANASVRWFDNLSWTPHLVPVNSLMLVSFLLVGTISGDAGVSAFAELSDTTGVAFNLFETSNPIDSFVLHLPILNDQPTLSIFMELHAGAIAGNIGIASNSVADYQHTFEITHISFVDPGGNPIPDVIIPSASGVDYNRFLSDAP